MHTGNRLLAAGVVAGLAAAASFGSPPGRAATSTATIAVSATVLAFCTITALPLAFGNYSSAQLDATTTLTASCTVGTPYTVGLDAGLGTGATTTTRKMTSTGSTLNYELFRDSARTLNWGNTIGTDTVAGTGNGLAQTLTVYGRILGSQLVAPGAYTDTVTATLTY
jgi:spore coat protein U-like protein